MVARSGIGRLALVDPMVVDVWDPPRRCEVRHLGRVVTGRGVFLVEEVSGDRSRVTWQEQLESRGIRRLVDAVAVAPTAAMLRVALRRLRRAVQSPPR
jgi:hypothetical protein